MLSRTSEYALRAMVYLTQNTDALPIPGRQIADDIAIPAKYLSSILRELVRSGVLLAAPGKSGGFRLARPPGDIRLGEVLEPFESAVAAATRCPFGNAVCSDADPCAGHDRWKGVKQAYEYFLANTSVHDVSIRQIHRRKCEP